MVTVALKVPSAGSFNKTEVGSSGAPPGTSLANGSMVTGTSCLVVPASGFTVGGGETATDRVPVPGVPFSSLTW
jgi:hypothetical protein